MKLEVLTPPANGFVLGRSVLGVGRLGNDPDVWDDLLDEATGVRAVRGGTTPQLNQLDLGTLTTTIRDSDPADDLRLMPGRQVRLVDDTRPGTPVLWYGRISDVPSADDTKRLSATIAAADVVSELANTKRVGVGTTGVADTLRQRADQLNTTSVTIRYVASGGEGAETPLAATDYDGYLLDHLNMACNSIWGAAWRPTLDGRVEVLHNTLTGAAVATITDEPADLGPGAVSYTNVTRGYASTDTLINEVVVKNNARPAGVTETTHQDITSVVTYGRRSLDLETCFSHTTLRDAYVTALLDTYKTPAWAVTSVTYRTEELDVLPDLLDLVHVRHRGTTYSCVVVGISYDLKTPTRCDTTLTLRKAA